MPAVKVKFEGDVDIVRIFINDRRLRLNGDGEGEVELPPGTHEITWFVRGTPGTDYMVAITEPEEAEFEFEDTIDEGSRDGGFAEFEVGGEE